MVLAKLLNPPKWVLILLPVIVFATLIFIFVSSRMTAFPAEYPDERNDTAYGGSKQWVFLPRIRHLHFSNVHILYDDNVCN